MDNKMAEVLNVSCPIDTCCKYCVYNCGIKVCGTRTDTCDNGIKKWLEQEEKSNE